MKKQLEQFALEIERHGETLPRGQIAIGNDGLKHHLARFDRAHTTAIEVAPGIRFRCIADAEATDRLAAKIRKARLPAKRNGKLPRGVGLGPDDLPAIIDQGTAYATGLQRAECRTVTLWPDEPKRATYRLQLERVTLAILAGRSVRVTRFCYGVPQLDLPERRELIDEAHEAGYTIRYADPDHWKECGEVRIAA